MTHITPEQEALEEMSDRNILRECGGNLKKLTSGQIKALRRRGIVKPKWGYMQGLTDKGLRMLAELKKTPSPEA